MRSSLLEGRPLSPSAKPTTAAPYFFASGRTVWSELSDALTLLMRHLPGAARSPRFNRRRIGGINLQGQTDRAADGGHHPAHQIDLIDSGQTDVDIQNLCARVRLVNRLRDDIIHILFAERLLKTLLARRIDSLADDAHTLSKRAYLARRANAMDGFSRPYRFFPRQFSAKRLNKCGRCSAAPADICRTDVGQFCTRCREFLRDPVWYWPSPDREAPHSASK